jgi:short-subunit dehydrogenase
VGGDVTDAELRRALIQTAREQLGGLDLLVNNAGVGAIGAFATADAARLRLVMETNFFAVAELIRDALPLLVDGADPAIVNIGSVLGHCAVPKKSEYCASKFALHGFTDALRMELAGDGVEVILVSPSTTDSEFFGRAMRSEGQASEKRRAMSAESVAEQAVRAIVKRRREVILSLGGRSLVWADRLFPGWTSRLLERFA